MTPSQNSSQVLVIAAETSSALYAQRLLELWKGQDVPIHAFGVGSQEMEALGFEIVGRSETMAVVGLQEVLKHYKHIKSVFDKLVKIAEERRPKFALLLDYPDFNLRLAAKLKKLNIPVIYYISPQVWAWRTSRVHKIKKIVDKMLVLFPFEKDFYQKFQVDVEFVGHPLLDELNEKIFDKNEVHQLRQRYGIDPQDYLVGLMPGSRLSELDHHLDTQLKTAEILYKNNPTLKFALLVAPNFSVNEIKEKLPDYRVPLLVIKEDPMKMVSLCDVVLCASGTATLLVGLVEKPMVIMYKMKVLTAWLAKRFVKSTPFFGMINLVLGKKVVSELFQEQASPEILSNELEALLLSPEKRMQMTTELKKAKDLLGHKGATDRVAKILEDFI